MSLREKIGKRLFDYQQASFIRFCDFLEDNEGREEDPIVKQRAEDIHTFKLGYEVHEFLDASASGRAARIIAENHKEYLRRWYHVTYYLCNMTWHRIYRWLNKPFFLFTIF